MCIICAEIARGKMTTSELRRASREIDMDPDHRRDVQEMIDEVAMDELLAETFAEFTAAE